MCAWVHCTNQGHITILLSFCSALFNYLCCVHVFLQVSRHWHAALVFPRRQWNDGGRPCHSWHAGAFSDMAEMSSSKVPMAPMWRRKRADWVCEVNGTHCPLRFWDPKSFQCVAFKPKRRNDGLLKGITGSQYIITDHTWSHLMPKPNSGHVARWVSLKVRCTVQGISIILQIRAIPP
jgi:hypothetical protein